MAKKDNTSMILISILLICCCSISIVSSIFSGGWAYIDSRFRSYVINKDQISTGEVIKSYPKLSIEKLKEKCDDDDKCIGFNSNGDLLKTQGSLNKDKKSDFYKKPKRNYNPARPWEDTEEDSDEDSDED